MTTSKNKASGIDKGNTKTSPAKIKGLETEMPLSEKDEVKKAEQRMSKAASKK